MWQCIECEHENPKTLSSCEKCTTSRPSSSLIGEQISQWVIERELGEGGMAVVFEARHKMLGSLVAIKILRADMMHKREVVERFKTEAKAASHLRHDNIIQVHDFGSQKGIGDYMVLEYLEGMDLEEKLEELTPSIPWVMNVTKQICSGLEAAHNAGIIHRDLKPSNIYLVPRRDHDIPVAKILDFGIAKIQESQLFDGPQNLTRTGTVLGTPYYLSPEQLRRRDKQELGPSVDIYALGVILYQLLTGQLPIEEPTLAEQMAAILTKTPPAIGTLKPELAGSSLELLLHRLLSKKPEERPGTIAEVWSELEKAAGAFNDPAIDAALRQQWKQTYKTPELHEVLGEQPSIFRQYGITMGLVLLLIVGGGFLGYTLINQNKTTNVKKQKPGPRPRTKLPEWMNLNNQGVLAYKSGNNLRAFKLWQESLRQLKEKAKTDNKSQAQLVQKSREILQSLTIVSQKSGRFYNALRFAQQLVKSKALPEKDRLLLQERIKSLQEGLNGTKKDLRFLAEALENAIKNKNYKVALGAYRTLLNHKDKSLPEPFIKAAASIEKILPSLSLKLYDKAHKLAASKKEKDSVDSKRSSVKNKVFAGRQAMKMLLQNVKRSRRIQRSFFKILEGQPHDAQMHDMIRQQIGKLLTTDPIIASWLLSRYAKSMKRIKRKPSWAWIADLSGKTFPSTKQFKQAMNAVRKERGSFRSASRLQRKIKNALKYGRMSKMLASMTKRQELQKQIWTNLSSVDSPLKKDAAKVLESLKEQRIQHTKTVTIWNKIKDLHSRDELSKANTDFQNLLATYKDTPTATGFNKLHKKWQTLHAKAAKYLIRGDKDAKRKSWEGCQYRFKRYLKIFPKSWQKESIELKRCKCRCKLPAPFEPCSERCKLPYK